MVIIVTLGEEEGEFYSSLAKNSGTIKKRSISNIGIS